MVKVRPHHYAAKAQFAYLQEMEAELGIETALIILDFSENYTFELKDAVQGYHWDNSQCTLHYLLFIMKMIHRTWIVLVFVWFGMSSV